MYSREYSPLSGGKTAVVVSQGQADFLIFRPESGTAGRPTVPDLAPDPDFFLFIQIFYLFPCTEESTALSPGEKQQWWCPRDKDVLRRDYLWGIDDAHPSLLSLSASSLLCRCFCCCCPHCLHHCLASSLPPSPPSSPSSL
jgi:hypothetical protein